jgi:hypothetical protein
LLLAGSSACAGFAPTAVHPPPQASPAEGWKTYSNPDYGYSISYPASLEITAAENDTSLFIGEQIHVLVSSADPLECRGDCPVVEGTEPAAIAGLAATKVTGYIGSIGGNVPQRYITYILPRDGRYYVFTLYALGFKAVSNDPSTIWPLKESDVALFEQVLDTFKLIN